MILILLDKKLLIFEEIWLFTCWSSLPLISDIIKETIVKIDLKIHCKIWKNLLTWRVHKNYSFKENWWQKQKMTKKFIIYTNHLASNKFLFFQISMAYNSDPYPWVSRDITYVIRSSTISILIGLFILFSLSWCDFCSGMKYDNGFY